MCQRGGLMWYGSDVMCDNRKGLAWCLLAVTILQIAAAKDCHKATSLKI